MVGLCVTAIAVSLCTRAILDGRGLATGAYVLTLARLDALTIGALLAVMARQPGGLRRLRGPAMAAGSVAVTGLCVMFVRGGGLDPEMAPVSTLGLSLLDVLCGSVLVFAVTSAPGSLLGRLLRDRRLRALGLYSYGLYVFHHPLVFLMDRYVLSVTDLPRVLGSQLPALFLSIGLTGGASLALAGLSWHLYEAPILRLKRFFAYRTQMSSSQVVP
jgi:peptidoglycan/LPS O-acetylase OafA/YrhL